jgi:hypothetical protein
MSDDVTIEPAKTLWVPEVGKRYFGLGRGASYAAAANGQIPTIKNRSPPSGTGCRGRADAGPSGEGEVMPRGSA